jgi:hypothetical protein
VFGAFKGQVISGLKCRPEGLCLRHRVGQNSLKTYDKQGSVLRVETRINELKGFKVYRPAEGGPEERLAWRKMRKGIADLQRRAEISQASNERYLQALAQLDAEQVLGEQLQGICQPTVTEGRPARALHPFGQDAALLKVLGRGEYALNGFRNRDLQQQLYQQLPQSTPEYSKRAARLTRRLRLLRAHGLIKKVPRTQRYHLTDKGRAILVALGAAAHASTKKLTELAA